ncbi:hypothetical protein [Kitasatospora sp. NPDC056800]|uniref:hypothetical protein n=1 Tax=Kitasatospora sp. NPDC056800 TaxID=3345948 RepID=UPI0036C5CB16
MVVVGPNEHAPGESAEPTELKEADWVLYESEQGMSEVVDRVTAVSGSPREPS